MLGEGRDYLTTAWWLATLPGLALAATALSITILGDFLRDFFDPRSSPLSRCGQALPQAQRDRRGRLEQALSTENGPDVDFQPHELGADRGRHGEC